MASTYSTNLKIELMATGENSGTWGNITNTNLGTALEQAVVGLGTVDYVADANLTISLTNSNSAQAARALVLNVTSGFGSLTQTRELIVPTFQKQYIVQNNTTGGQSITVKTSAGTGITVPNGRKAHLYVDGTNVIQMFDFVDINGGAIDGTTVGANSASTGAFTTLAASSTTTLSGLTASTALALNASKEVVSVTNTGTGNNVLATGPTLVTPTLGAATATSINKVTITAPATAATLTLSNGSSLITSGGHSLTLTTTGATNVTLPTSGTLATTGGTVASIGFGTTGLTPNTATTGAVTVAGTLAAANGGTGVDNGTRTLTISNNAGTLNFTAASKTLGISNSLTLAGTDATTMTFPATSTTVAGLSIAQTFSAAQTFSDAVTFSATTQNISLGASQTSGTFVLGGTAATGAITLDGSTKTHTLGLGSGATENAATKTINIGTGGVSSSTTTITIGSANGTTTTVNGTLNATTVDLTNLEVTNIKAKDGTASIALADSTGVATFSANPIINAGTANAVPYLNAAKVLTTGSALTFDGTNFGVGTASPAVKLDVAGTIYATAVYAQTIESASSFSWNTSTSSPAASSPNPYGGGVPVVTNIHRNMRRCLLADDGTVNYYLDESDSTLKADGSAADLTGADGMVMVEIPAFYVKREVSGSIITWSVSDVPLSGFDLHPAFHKDGNDVEYRYYSAYDACVYDVGAASYISGLNYDNNSSPNGQEVDVTASTGDKLASVSGIYPMVGLTRPEFRTIAANRGTGWRQLDYTLLAAVQLLYLIEYQTFYSQNTTGDGNTGTTNDASSGTQADNGASEAGKSNSIGNASTNTTNGASSASRQVAWMSYRGIENFYGNAWNWADGVIVNAAGSVSADSATWHFTNNSADFSDTVSTNMTLITSSGQTTGDYPDALASVDNFFISTSGGGSSTTYTTNYWYGTTTAERVVRVSGGVTDGATAGAFLVHASSAAGDRARNRGARLTY